MKIVREFGELTAEEARVFGAGVVADLEALAVSPLVALLARRRLEGVRLARAEAHCPEPAAVARAGQLAVLGPMDRDIAIATGVGTQVIEHYLLLDDIASA